MRELTLKEIDMVSGGLDSSYYDGSGTAITGGTDSGAGQSSNPASGTSGTQTGTTAGGTSASTASAISELQQFMNDLSNSSNGLTGDEHSSYFDNENYAPLGQEYLNQFGWLPTVQNDPSSHYYDFLTNDVDPEFSMPISDIGSLNSSINGHQISLTSDLGSGSLIADDNGAIFLLQKHVGSGNAPQDGEIVVTGETWDVLLVGHANTDISSINYSQNSVQTASFHQYTTPGGTSFSTIMNLNGTQISTAEKIIDYGISHNFSMSEVTIAVDQAFYESSLGTMMQNPTSSATGVFMFKPATWNDTFPSMNINSTTDQISAMFSEIKKFEGERVTEIQNGTIPSNYGLESYVEVRHHLGDYSQDFNSPVVTQYLLRSSTLGLGLNGASWGTSS